MKREREHDEGAGEEAPHGVGCLHRDQGTNVYFQGSKEKDLASGSTVNTSQEFFAYHIFKYNMGVRAWLGAMLSDFTIQFVFVARPVHLQL